MARLGPSLIQRIQLVSVGIKGGTNIKAGLQIAKIELWRQWVERMVNWANQFTPYRSGATLFSVLQEILTSTPDRYYIGAMTVYASFVNDMQPVINWTNPATKYYFYTKMQAFGKQIIKPMLAGIIRSLGLAVGTQFDTAQFPINAFVNEVLA